MIDPVPEAVDLVAFPAVEVSGEERHDPGRVGPDEDGLAGCGAELHRYLPVRDGLALLRTLPVENDLPALVLLVLLEDGGLLDPEGLRYIFPILLNSDESVGESCHLVPHLA